MSEIVYGSCISSVKDEISRLNTCRPPRPLIYPKEPSSLSNHTGVSEEPERVAYEDEHDDGISVSSQGTVASTCSRAKKSDIYTLAPEETILAIIKEIDEGRFVSNTKCVSWIRGAKHHPCHPDTFKVRRHLLFTGPQARDQIHEAIPTIGEKLLRSILHELKEQGIVIVKN
uniref:Uncharacterized protein n=1 Tax=viral metagenome TaxID=1070528 RepID=A0A6C0K460_9ZZZZ